MNLGVDIALGFGSALLMRAASNAAFRATQPVVDPAMPTAGPVLAALGVPGIAGGIAAAYKYPKVASVLFGIGVGGAVSAYEYMAYAKAPADSYTWNIGYDDGTVKTLGPIQGDAAKIQSNDVLVLGTYLPDPKVVAIQRIGSNGAHVTLLDRSPQVLQQGNPHVAIPQSAGAMRLRMR